MTEQTPTPAPESKEGLGKFDPDKSEPAKTVIPTIAANINKAFTPPSEQPIDLIKQRMKETGQLPGQKPPVFVDEKGRPIFNEPKVDAKPLPDAQAKVPIITIDGYKFPISGTPLDAMTFFMYIMAAHFSKDPAVAAILDQFQFELKDFEGKQIYPRPNAKPTPKSKRSKPQ